MGAQRQRQQTKQQTSTMAPTRNSGYKQRTGEIHRCKSIQTKHTPKRRASAGVLKSGFHPVSDFNPSINGDAAIVAGTKQLVKVDKRKGGKVGVVLKSFGDTQQVYVDSLHDDTLLKDSVSEGDVLYSVNGTKVHSATEAADLMAKPTTLLLLFVPRAPQQSAEAEAGVHSRALETVRL